MTASAEEIMRLEREMRNVNRRCMDLAAKVDFATNALRQVEQERTVAVQNAQAIYKALLVALGGDDGNSG